jgi:hypothetical protein
MRQDRPIDPKMTLRQIATSLREQKIDVDKERRRDSRNAAPLSVPVPQ